MGGEFVGDGTFTYVFFVGEAEVFFGSDVAEHGASIPADVGSADAGGDMVVAGGDVGSEGAEGVEGGFVAPVELFFHIFFDHVKGYMAGSFVHDLHVVFPGALGEFALGF